MCHGNSTRERLVFSTNSIRTIGYHIQKYYLPDEKILYILTPYTKINSKQIIQLNLRARTKKTSGKNSSRRSLWAWTTQRVLRSDTKSIIH